MVVQTSTNLTNGVKSNESNNQSKYKDLIGSTQPRALTIRRQYNSIFERNDQCLMSFKKY